VLSLRPEIWENFFTGTEIMSGNKTMILY
jgi:hypothetical protein